MSGGAVPKSRNPRVTIQLHESTRTLLEGMKSALGVATWDDLFLWIVRHPPKGHPDMNS